MAKKESIGPKPGDQVLLKTAGEEIQGTLMPNVSDSVIVKLDNGYNIGIDRQKIKEMKGLKSRAEKQADTKPAKQNPKLPKICILHTGGTIASKVDYKTGGVTARYTAEDLLAMFPELMHIANIQTELVSNMMSEDNTFSDYQKIITAVKNSVGNCDGIILGSGTDTLAYTSAALAFALRGLPIPLLVVGCQRSTDRGSTDGPMNLICAAHFIAKAKFKGVAICMHNSMSDDVCAILPATKTRKMHTSRRDAFKPINSAPIALVDPVNGGIKWNKNPAIEQFEDFKPLDKFSQAVGLIKTHPAMDPKLFEFATKNYKALVIEATGLGHMPTNLGENLRNYEALKEFISKGGIVAVTSQCLFGRVNPYVYTNLRRLADIGCIFCEDMLPETAFVKLSWLLGNFSPQEAKELLAQNLVGEISQRTSEESYL